MTYGFVSGRGCKFKNPNRAQIKARNGREGALSNLLNVGPVLAVNTAYGPLWLAPTATLPGRMFKFGTQINW
jgi:hypothetical protein